MCFTGLGANSEQPALFSEEQKGENVPAFVQFGEGNLESSEKTNNSDF